MIKKHRPSGKPKSFLHVVKGKLAFLRSVRSGRNSIFIKLAKQFNDLVEDEQKFKITETTAPEKNAINSLWVIDACHDNEPEAQGTGFQLEGAGIVTCAHVISNEKIVFNHIEVYKHSNTVDKYKIQVDRIDHHRDIAICSIQKSTDKSPPSDSIKKSEKSSSMQEKVTLLGFPAYGPGQSHYIADAKIARIYPESGISKFEIDHQIREGNSGGPIINLNSKVIGVALAGARMEAGKNACLSISEIEAVLESDEYKV